MFTGTFPFSICWSCRKHLYEHYNSPGTSGLYLTFGRQFFSKVVFYLFALTTIQVFIIMVFKGYNLGDDKGEDHNLGELFLSWKSPGEHILPFRSYVILRTSKPFLCGPVSQFFYMIVEWLLASANFVTNVTLHLIFTMNYFMEPQFFRSEKRFPKNFTNKSQTW